MRFHVTFRFVVYHNKVALHGHNQSGKQDEYGDAARQKIEHIHFVPLKKVALRRVELREPAVFACIVDEREEHVDEVGDGDDAQILVDAVLERFAFGEDQNGYEVGDCAHEAQIGQHVLPNEHVDENDSSRRLNLLARHYFMQI